MSVKFQNVYCSISLPCISYHIPVTSGLCYKNCPSGNVPYGVNYPGAVVYYKTMKTDRTPQQSAGGCFRSDHFN